MVYMEQMNVPEDWKVTVNFDDPVLPASIKTFRPLVYQEGEAVCCVLGPDPQEGIFGCGTTVDEAMRDWDEHLQDRIQYHKEDDEVARFISDTLKADVKKIW